ncbi:MAG: DUF4815 domain-containing protein [Alphaproteobacteria bacterium]|nr:DUF4815 domain-containing protein [Alphaproteobacteria bacterium]
MPISGHYDHFNKNKPYDAILYRVDRALQGAELNEMQSRHAARIAELGAVLFKDGAVIRGCEVRIDAETGETSVSAGTLWVRGAVRGVAAGSMTIPVIGLAEIGVHVVETTVTELEDPSLLDPAVETHNYQQPGAARRAITLEWGWRAGVLGDGAAGDFYRVFSATNGVLDAMAPPPQLDGVQLALARYDRASTGGTYVVEGLAPRALDIVAGQQVFSLQEGRAHVDGYEIEKPTATRLTFDADPDLMLIEAEPHTFAPNGSGVMRIDVVHGPLAELVEVKVTAQRVDVMLVHGAYTGAVDPLPDVSVLQIVSVAQGATNYVVGGDCKLTGNGVDWSLAGAEPAPGSSYTVTYKYFTDGTVTLADDAGFTVGGAVSGSLVMVDYRHKLRRFDRLVMDRDGRCHRVRGVGDLIGPAVPAAPAGMLPLATLDQTWWAMPRVILDAPKVMPVGELRALSNRVDVLFDLVAIERLKSDATAREPTTAKGLFVDPFLDDDMRDAGVIQDAAIVSGELTLPIAPIFTDPLAAGDQHMLTYALEPVLSQELVTGGMKVNPYMAFAPIPPKLTVTPQVDRWTERRDVWGGDSVRFLRVGHFVDGVSRVANTTTLEDRIETVERSETAAQFLRRISLHVKIENLGPGEIVDAIRFDGIQVGGGMVANGAGVVEYDFQIPPDVPSGAKRVEAACRATGLGVATFVGEGRIATEVRRRVATIEEFHVDPVAQTFMLPDGRHIGGVDLWFRAKGASQVVVQIRDVLLGLPAVTVLAETRLVPADIRTDGQPTRVAWRPVWLEAGREFAIVVLCDDADAEVSIAELGKFDETRQRWVTVQPYQIGVLLSSSNNSTWTPHQAADLTFRLLGCRFTATSRAVSLGVLGAADVSDLVALFNSERPDAATRIALRLTAPDGAIYSLADGQPMNLPLRLTGDLTVQAVLEGTDLRSPVLHPGIQAIFGVLSDSATYVSRAFPCGTAAKVRVVYEAFKPGTATVTPAVQAGDGAWVEVPLTAGQAVGDGWEEFSHILPAHTAAQTRLRLTLAGSAAARPRVRRLRCIVT